uniref:hypothetical protein n=1 Tax=Providencia rettgeri TaxID=587 RepID=UPI001F48CB3C
MSENVLKPYAEMTDEEKLERYNALSKAASKAVKSSINLDDDERKIKTEVKEASEKVNELSKKLGSGESHDREAYDVAMKELNSANKRLGKFLDNYEDKRDGTGAHLKALQDFIGEMIGEIYDEQPF